MRLIDADALKEKMQRTNRYFDVKFDIDEAPTIDAEPVRHGHWEFPIFCDDYSSANDPRCKCSECGSIEMPLARHNYCPHCGAKMDEVKE